MSFLCRNNEAYEVALLLKDYLQPVRSNEDSRPNDLDVLLDHYELSDADSERIFAECCARRHEWAIDKSSSFLKNTLVPQMMTHALENFLNFLNVSRTTWLTKGDIILLRTIQYRKEEFSTMYESLVDLVPYKTDYDWTIVDNSGIECDDREDFDALDVTDSVFFSTTLADDQTLPDFSRKVFKPDNDNLFNNSINNNNNNNISRKGFNSYLNSFPTPSPTLKRPRSPDNVVLVPSPMISNRTSLSNKTTEEPLRNLKKSGDFFAHCRMSDMSDSFQDNILSSNFISSIKTIEDSDLSDIDFEVTPKTSTKRGRRSSTVKKTPPATKAPTVLRSSTRKPAKNNPKPIPTKSSAKKPRIEKDSGIIDLSPPSKNSLQDELIKAQIKKELAMAEYYAAQAEKTKMEMRSLSF